MKCPHPLPLKIAVIKHFSPRPIVKFKSICIFPVKYSFAAVKPFPPRFQHEGVKPLNCKSCPAPGAAVTVGTFNCDVRLLNVAGQSSVQLMPRWTSGGCVTHVGGWLVSRPAPSFDILLTPASPRWPNIECQVVKVTPWRVMRTLGTGRGGGARLNIGAEVRLGYYKHSDITLTSFSAETLYLSSYCCDDPRTKEPPCDDEWIIVGHFDTIFLI